MLLEELQFFGQQGDVAELCVAGGLSTAELEGCTRESASWHTSDLFLEPAVGGARQLLVGSAVGEGVRHRNMSEVFEDGALHGQLIEIRVQEGDDTLWIGRGAIEVHGAVQLSLWGGRLSLWIVVVMGGR